MALDIHAWTQDSPIGPLLVATTSDGVCLIDWAMTAVSRMRLDAAGQVVDSANAAVVSAFDSYFDGATSALDSLAVDLRFARGKFVLAVLQQLAPASGGYNDELRRLGTGGRTARSSPSSWSSRWIEPRSDRGAVPQGGQRRRIARRLLRWPRQQTIPLGSRGICRSARRLGCRRRRGGERRSTGARALIRVLALGRDRRLVSRRSVARTQSGRRSTR